MDLITQLKKDPTTEKLSLLPQVVLDEAHVEELAEALESSSSLTNLTMIGNRLGEAGFIQIVKALTKSNCQPVAITVGANEIGAEGAVALSELLHGDCRIEDLRLVDNSIGGGGAASLAAALTSCKFLKILNLNDNGIGDEGAVAVASFLAAHRGIVTLYLEWNGIEVEGGNALASAIAGQRTLKSLFIFKGNRMGCRNNDQIERAIKKMRGSTATQKTPKPLPAPHTAAVTEQPTCAKAKRSSASRRSRGPPPKTWRTSIRSYAAPPLALITKYKLPLGVILIAVACAYQFGPLMLPSPRPPPLLSGVLMLVFTVIVGSMALMVYLFFSTDLEKPD
eukprot:CAMPEP_0119327950 /NCGR_PEP_ID=MMETSP1333-20130426/72029_1 /TAXON_ID=418940 /ORGANISM="Scyphosphaera apsteinii, Strain RCC1455" /LENGTH=336 /DNA_ID=CAMNT_0007336677 /DNA_START=134 /DNA_END=1144 /DNA_ORIENTATION=+